MEFKKLSFRFILTCLVMLVMGVSEAKADGTVTDEDGITWQIVVNSSEFKAAIKANKNLWVKRDIDLSEIGAEDDDSLFDEDFKFTGRVRGDYVNLNREECDAVLSNSSFMLFKEIENAHFMNLVFSNCSFKGWDTHSGQLAAVATNCEFQNVVLLGCSSVGDSDGWDCDQMGGLIGIADGCTFNKVFAMGTKLVTDGQNAGLIVGKAQNSTFSDCATNAACSIWADGNSEGLGYLENAYCGGLCGNSYNCTFVNCINMALVSADDDTVGGIIGYGEKTKMTDCQNMGMVCHNTKSGFNSMSDRLEKVTASALIGVTSTAAAFAIGATAYAAVHAARVLMHSMTFYYVFIDAAKFLLPILGYVAAGVAVAAVAAVVVIALYDPDEMGGIAGTIADNSSILRCSNYGFVDCYDAYAGGIVGHAEKSNIEQCLNHALVSGDQQVGGIAGYIKNCTLLSNLNIGAVKANSDMGDIEGKSEDASTFGNNYFLAAEASDKYLAGKAITQEQLASGEIVLKLNQGIGSSVFRQDLGNSIYPTLNPSDPEVTATIEVTEDMLWQKVSNVIDLANAMCNPASKIELTDDVNMAGRMSYCNFTKAKPFIGEIKGNGHMIMNCGYSVYSQDSQVDAGLFSYAKGAKFSDLIIDNFHISQTDQIFGHHTHEGIFVAVSEGCTYENVSVRNSSIRKNSGDDWLEIVGGLVGYSTNDVFNYCTAEPSCTFEGYSGASNRDTNVGGLVGYAVGSKFQYCHNAANVIADDNNDGGIVGYIENGEILYSLNTGVVEGQDYVGGIVGFAEKTEIGKCVNAGTVTGDDAGNSYLGGIVGALSGSGSIVEYCLGFGKILNADDEDCGGIDGARINDAQYGEGNEYNFYHSYYGNLKNVAIEDITSGKFAYFKKDYWNKKFLYQSIDNGGWYTSYPVPIPAAGKIYLNYECGTKTNVFSNLYDNVDGHQSQHNKFGVCEVCGSVGTLSSTNISIEDANDMLNLALAVDKGQDFSGCTISLANDIDLSTLEGNASYIFNGIGNSTHPFSGTFDGMGHTISNLIVDKNWGEAGLFPDVKGTTNISNVVLDNSCVINTSCYGAGGIVGVTRGHCALSLSQCGFNGYVSGRCNVASMLGAVFESTNGSNITINRCYNTGTVNGGELSAAICGYANDELSVTDTWNSGTVSGYVSGLPFLRYTGSKTVTYDNCFDINTQSKINKIKADDVASGSLCYQLNRNVDGRDDNSSWYQKMGEDAIPMWEKRGGDLVYKHEFCYCDAPSVTFAEYNNSPEAIASIRHDYDEDGFCHRAEEEHYEPALLEENEWKVNNMGNLYWIAQEVNSGAEQNNIALLHDLTDNKNVIVDGALNANTATFRNWTPIGTEEHPFAKTFNGNLHTISGIYCDAAEIVHAGLIGYMGNKETAVCNVGVVDSYFSGSMYIGAIAGYVDDTSYSSENPPKIYHCYSSGIIKNGLFSGGIVGEYSASRAHYTDACVYDCYSLCKILPRTQWGSKYLGGIIGETTLTKAEGCYYIDDFNLGGDNLVESEFGEAKSEFAFKFGEVALLMNASSNGWAQDISTDATPKFGSDGVKYTRQVTPGNWASLVLPFKVNSTDDVQLYTFKSLGSDNTLNVTPAESVPANTPCFFKTKGDCSLLSLVFAKDDYVAPSGAQVHVQKQLSDNTILTLQGTYEDIEVSADNPVANYFVAQNKLWWGEENFTLPAFRGYLEIMNFDGIIFMPKKLTLRIDDNTTGINSVNIEQPTADGKYLMNGKLVIVRNGKKYDINGIAIQ